MLQQLSTLFKSFKIPSIIYADFNFAPEVLEASGWLNEHSANMSIPNVPSTCKGSSKVIDFCIVSRIIAPFFTLEVVHVPWGPHVGLKVCLEQYPTKTFVRKFVEPLPLPMDSFHEKWKCMTPMHQNSCIAMATCTAHGMLTRHALQHRCAAILGKP